MQSQGIQEERGISKEGGFGFRPVEGTEEAGRNGAMGEGGASLIHCTHAYEVVCPGLCLALGVQRIKQSLLCVCFNFHRR